MDLSFAGSCKSFAEAPLIKPKYAGTNGNVHGAKNVRRPAINAGKIKEALVIH
jgi:hypothetical protein